jgi:hypothetical protein
MITAGGDAVPAPKAKLVPITQLKPHPRNYRAHPDDQLDHLVESIKEHGFYRNVVAAKDWTILAGHGVVLAAKKLGLPEVSVIRLDLDPEDPRALKLLVGDNELGHLAEIDDRALTELLKGIKDLDVNGLLGTGYDEAMLANLVFVTRPASEVRSQNEAGEWAGMPDLGQNPEKFQLVITFGSEDDREAFVKQQALTISKVAGRVSSCYWPADSRQDLKSLRFEDSP